jgi:hypothetical protein
VRGLIAHRARVHRDLLPARGHVQERVQVLRRHGRGREHPQAAALGRALHGRVDPLQSQPLPRLLQRGDAVLGHAPRLSRVVVGRPIAVMRDEPNRGAALVIT